MHPFRSLSTKSIFYAAILFLFAIIIALGLRVWYEGSHYMNDVLGLESADARSRSLSDALLDLTFERARSAVFSRRNSPRRRRTSPTSATAATAARRSWATISPAFRGIPPESASCTNRWKRLRRRWTSSSSCPSGNAIRRLSTCGSGTRTCSSRGSNWNSNGWPSSRATRRGATSPSRCSGSRRRCSGATRRGSPP